MFDYDVSDELRFKIKRLVKKDKKRAEILHKKIKQIIHSDKESINHYKNLKHDLREF